jgi:hypothetical protein
MLDDLVELVFDLVDARHWRFWLCMAITVPLAVWAFTHMAAGGLRIGAVVGIGLAGLLAAAVWEAAGSA